MSFKSAAATVAVALLLAGAPALVLADSSSPASPIVVDRVQVISPELAGGEMYRPGTLNVAFHNTRNVAATDLSFEVSANGQHLDYVHDTGTFSPGSTIDHDFPDNSYASNQQVTVFWAIFADGTVWVNDRTAGSYASR